MSLKRVRGFLLFKNIDTKKKILVNMLLAQLGFATISTTAILSSSHIMSLIIVNLIFALLIAYTNFAAMNRIIGGIDRFRNHMDEIMDFVFMRTNSVKKASHIKNDEIGMILTEMNHYIDMIDAIRKEDMKVLGEIVLSMDKISRGTYTCKITSDSHNFMIRALRDTINNMIETSRLNMKSITSTLDSYSNNDYTSKISIDKKLTDEMLQVMNSINSLGEALAYNAKTNLSNGLTISKNSEDMTVSINNVANQATEQAASLEETSAALEEITSITKNNTINTDKMATLGKNVKEAVRKGQTLASQTNSSMDEINEEVSSINEAITIIDQIAFQTNILSLNAAVEAATAGEAGKGFAVVAGEVRNLANRSAQAASEIKVLIEKATQKATTGKSISDSMIQGYQELNKHINETISLIDEVAIASKEQMKGIEQINDTVSVLDKATQENASEASKVADISNEMVQIANDLLTDAKEKKFN